MTVTDPRLHHVRAARERCQSTHFDLVVIGGGATGLGVALDAASRGWSVMVVDSHDFASGTSSRSTKLLHGGVRYLAQGDVGLVREALHERTRVLANAPHVAQPLEFVIPARGPWEAVTYTAGLKVYDALSWGHRLGSVRWWGAAALKERLPGLREGPWCGAVSYLDGQFDDARLALALAKTAQQHGACLLNHVQVVGLLTGQDGRIRGVQVQDRLSPLAAAEGNAQNSSWEIRSHGVVNAAGVWVDEVSAMQATTAPRVRPSQGVHLVVGRHFLPGSRALLVPRTRDGRVLFAVPWLGKTVLGTTDTPTQRSLREPQALPEEVDFILTEAAAYLNQPPTRDDVRSVWVGLRPLVQPMTSGSGAAVPTASLSREHVVDVSPSGLITVTGGKWTTYRAMAEEVILACQRHAGLPLGTPRSTASMPLWGAAPGVSLADPPGEHLYGSEAATLQALPGAQRWLAHDRETGRGILSEAMVRYAVRHEWACTLQDVLARRSRLLFLDAQQAAAVAPDVARVLAQERGSDYDEAADIQALTTLAAQYASVP